MKKFFKFGCLGIIAFNVLIVIGVVIFGDKEPAPTNEIATTNAIEPPSTNEPIDKPEGTNEVVEEIVEEVPDVPREHAAALKKAESYAANMNMSKAGIYNQLTSEHGEGFPAEAAQYAIDNLEWDYKANALEKAKSYAENMSMSNSAIYDQLISEHGERFTVEEAQYAVDNLQ